MMIRRRKIGNYEKSIDEWYLHKVVSFWGMYIERYQIDT